MLALICGEIKICLTIFLFRGIKRKVRFSPDAKVIFGWNVSGLVAAEKFASVWPEMKNNCFVTCSVFRASVKAFGLVSESRSLPVSRGNVQLVHSTAECYQVIYNQLDVLFPPLCLDEVNRGRVGEGLPCHYGD